MFLKIMLNSQENTCVIVCSDVNFSEGFNFGKEASLKIANLLNKGLYH